MGSAVDAKLKTMILLRESTNSQFVSAVRDWLHEALPLLCLIVDLARFAEEREEGL